MGKYLKKIKSEKQNYHKFYFSLFYYQLLLSGKNQESIRSTAQVLKKQG